MYSHPKYGLILLIFFIFHLTDLSAQELNGSSGYNQIQAEFKKENIKIEPQDAFFNVLKITNNSSRKQFVNLTFETPLGWNLITDQQQRINLDARDSILIPLRASTNRGVKGEIGYSIVASLTTRSDQPITTAYCFVKIPRRTDLSFRPLSRISYIDQKSQKGSFAYRLINDGNIDEVVYLEFTSTNNIEIRGEVNNTYTTDLTVPAKSDTVIRHEVVLSKKEDIQSLYKVNLNGHTETKEFSTAFWFKYLSNSYRHTLSVDEVPLMVSLNFENLFSESTSNISGYARGNLLFKNNRDISYYFYKYGNTQQDFFKYSRFFVNYQSNRLNIKAGNRVNFYSRNGYGRGVALAYKFFENSWIEGKYNRNYFHPINNYGLSYEWSNPEYRFGADFEYSNDLFRDQQGLLGLITGSGSLSKHHHLKAQFGLSDWSGRNFVPFDRLGYHYRINYQGRIKKVKFRVRNRFNSKDYYGRLAGRNRMSVNISYPNFRGYRLNLFYHSNRSTPNQRDITEQTDKYTLNRRLFLRASRQITPEMNLYGGPVYDYFQSNAYYGENIDQTFDTQGPALKVGTRFRFGTQKRLNASIKAGYTFVTDYFPIEEDTEERILEERTENFNSVFDFNYFARSWGVFFRYYYGPYNGNQYFNYFYQGSFDQSLRLMPYYRDYIYEDLIELDSRLNYMYTVNYKTHRANWSNHIRFHMDQGLTLEAIANVTLQSSLGQSSAIIDQSESKYTYSNSYFELRLKKEFSWNQPRNKYYNLQVTLYKDLNGNLKKDYNEPGVQDVLVNIEKLDPSKIDSIEADYSYSGSLVNNRLLSGMKGKVSYENMPQGVYKIILRSVGQQTGKFSADQQEVLVHMNRDRNIQIPYLERNKIYGKVILNRSKLSNLGSLNKGNIKVTAVDSKGRKTSTLTDKEGEFVIYAPSVDKYDVYINNIFKEHFDLRKNHYTVQLNGYKQFEVNFIFDEKRREINFTPSMTETDVEVKSVKRTNLTGTVKDENTLQPIRATIEVVDNKTGSTVETTHSDRETGRFSMSFMTGTNYSLIVSAQGYWLHTESLDLDQMLTIQDVEKEILMKNIMIGSRLDLENLRFAPESDEIPNDAYPELDRLIQQLKDNPNVRIQIAGHADALEQLESEDVSEERAKAVAKYIMQNGFSNIEYVGYKADKPVAPNDSPENRAKNRRVEITVVDK